MLQKRKANIVTGIHIGMVLSLVLMVFGCATTPTAQDIASANYGNPPTNLENTITAYLRQVLKDPDSLQDLRIGAPKRGWARTNYGKDVLYGYWVGYSCNAKNSFGGYVGSKYYCAFFQNNYIRQTWSEDHCRQFAHTIE